MNDEKPKHKPQQKHTLSEVLKSLQDLIRTELIPGQSAAKPGTATPPPATAPSSNEPDSFDQALDSLDRMITERIIEPVERARETPPEPLLPDETLEIEWDEAAMEGDDADKPRARDFTDTAASPNDMVLPEDETIELEPVAGEMEPPSPEGIETVELDAAETQDAAPAERDEGMLQEEPSQETIELLDSSEPAAETDGQRTFGFGDPPVETATPGDLTALFEDSSQPPEMTTEAAVVAREATAAPRTPGDAGDRASDPSAGTTEVEPEPKAVSEGSVPPADAAPDSAAIPALTVEYTEAAMAASGETPASMQPAAGTNDANEDAKEAGEEHAVKAKPTPTDKVPENRQSPPAAEERDAQRGSSGPPAQPAAPGATAGEEIPVLKEVANLDAPPAPPLPDASQARDIAIRVIAKLNIERRKTGERPLDIKTIERLQQYLADALTKRALNKPK